MLTNLLGVQITLSPLTLACALLAGAGMFVLVSALGMFGGARIQIGGGLSLAAESKRIDDDSPYSGTFIERVLGPIIREVMVRSGQNEQHWVEQAYDLLDRKTGSSDYYTRKVLGGLAGFALGMLAGVLAAGNGLLLMMLILPLGLSILGYFLPQIELRHELKQRAEQIVFEVPYALDRLGINVLAHNGDLVEGLRTTLQRPEGGYLMRELLQVIEDTARGSPIAQALARMGERNREIPIMVRIAELLTNSQRGALDLAQSLQNIGDRATEEVENMIRRRGEENSQAMVAPSMIALIGIMAALIGPSLLELGRFVR